MDSRNFDPNVGTPLYDQSVVLLGTVLAKTRQFAAAGVPARTVTLIITDGADAGSVRSRAADVKVLVTDMLKAERHIVAAMGVDDGSTDFREVFREMGIEDRWILTPGSGAGDIRRAFQVFSQSALRASQSAGSFSKTSVGDSGLLTVKWGHPIFTIKNVARWRAGAAIINYHLGAWHSYSSYSPVR